VLTAIYRPASLIPEVILRACPSTTNGNEQAHCSANHDGVNLTLLGGIMQGRDFDEHAAQSMEIHTLLGINTCGQDSTHVCWAMRSIVQQGNITLLVIVLFKSDMLLALVQRRQATVAIAKHAPSRQSNNLISASTPENHDIVPPSLLVQYPPCPTHTLKCALQSDVTGAPDLWPRCTATILQPSLYQHHTKGKLPLSHFSTLTDALNDTIATRRSGTIVLPPSTYVSMLQHALTPGANIIDYWPPPEVISNSTADMCNNHSLESMWYPIQIPLSQFSTLAGAIDKGPLLKRR
jgi:hypothetical protein